MTVLTIRAQDTATAMDEIIEKLGKDSFIIGTKKIGNEILVKATNKPKKENKPQKKVNQKFDEIISKELNVSSPLSTFKKDISTKKRGNNEKLDIGYLNEDKINNLNSEFKALKKQLNGMILTDMAGLSPNLRNTTKVKLQGIGFSNNTLIKFNDKLENENSEEGFQNFIGELASSLTLDDSIDSLIKSKYVFIVGTSGSGKTSFAAKLAAALVQEIKNDNVALCKLGKQNEFLNDNLKSYSRLINVPNVHILQENAQQKIQSIEKKLIIDVSIDSEETLNLLKNFKEKVGANKILTILVVPSGSNKYNLRKLLDIYGSINPILAFTKLDENDISPEELSVVAENNCSIGYLTNTKSILKSINFSNKEILAQYLKDNIIKFCEWELQWQSQ